MWLTLYTSRCFALSRIDIFVRMGVLVFISSVSMQGINSLYVMLENHITCLLVQEEHMSAWHNDNMLNIFLATCQCLS
jgi:hypothetical protein